MNIVLTGMPACGKTTVSALIAERTGRRLVDTDSELVREHGVISDIFARFGEEYFRDLESAVVGRVSALDNAVISTGGGCVLRGENVLAFKRGGVIFYLKADLDTLYARLKEDGTRPLLAGNAKERLKELYDARAAIYERTADVVIATDGLTPEEVAAEISEQIKRYPE